MFLPMLMVVCYLMVVYFLLDSYLYKKEDIPSIENIDDSNVEKLSLEGSFNLLLLKDYVFWHFSTPPGYPGRCGKMPNHSKIAPGGLGLCECDFFPQTRFLTN